MTRTEITQRALRSAATVTITMLLGCGASVDLEPALEGASAEAPTEAPAQPPAQPVADAAPEAEAPPIALTLHCSMGDGGPDALQAYTACCAALQWSPKSGCQAWGPPMPPAMEEA